MLSVIGYILIYDIYEKGKRSFPIKFGLNLFKGSQGSGQGPEVLNGVWGVASRTKEVGICLRSLKR